MASVVRRMYRSKTNEDLKFGVARLTFGVESGSQPNAP